MVVTRCPNCHARFRVSDGQLKLAAGQVRCGACLLVFDAQQHRLQPTQPAPSAAAVPPAQATATSTASAATPPQVTANEPHAPQSPEPPVSETPAVEQLTTAPAPARVSLTADDQTPSGQVPIEEEAPSREPASDPLNGMRTEALYLGHPADNDPNPVKTTGWLLLCLLAILGLGAQLVWFERAQLARHGELNSLYALLCNQVDCTLERPALNLIENHGLVLQPHPQYRDALNATILLENRAPFEQPWPALNLRFTDLKGRLVAQRTFQPDEYLDAQVLDPRQMPPGQSMQINLELAAPGRRGTSYELQLVAPL